MDTFENQQNPQFFQHSSNYQVTLQLQEIGTKNVAQLVRRIEKTERDAILTIQQAGNVRHQ